jgi:hypothetical protein
VRGTVHPGEGRAPRVRFAPPVTGDNYPQIMVRWCQRCGARMSRDHKGTLRCGCGNVRFS